MEEEDKKSSVKGVSWDKKNRKWIVKLANKYFGSFENLDDAVKRRREVETQKTPVRFCVVCEKPIPPDRHRNATTCSEACAKEKSRRYMALRHDSKKGSSQKRSGNRMHALTVFVPQNVFEELKTTAQEREISVGEYVRELIQQGIENEEENK